MQAILELFFLGCDLGVYRAVSEGLTETHPSSDPGEPPWVQGAGRGLRGGSTMTAWVFKAVRHIRSDCHLSSPEEVVFISSLNLPTKATDGGPSTEGAIEAGVRAARK
jgi:hypothetical protein